MLVRELVLQTTLLIVDLVVGRILVFQLLIFLGYKIMMNMALWWVTVVSPINLMCPVCFGEGLLRANNKGAVGYIGGSNNTYWDEDFWWAVGNGSISRQILLMQVLA